MRHKLLTGLLVLAALAAGQVEPNQQRTSVATDRAVETKEVESAPSSASAPSVPEVTTAPSPTLDDAGATVVPPVSETSVEGRRALLRKRLEERRAEALLTPSSTPVAPTNALVASPSGLDTPPSGSSIPGPSVAADNIGTTTPSPEAAPDALYSVVKVVDGDTIDVLVDGEKQRIRLIGVDTPETVDPRKPVQCFGQEASAKMKELLTGKTVRLAVDPTQGDVDKYNRPLRYVYRDEGLFLNEWLIAEGYAHEYTYATPYRFQASFKAAERKAREEERGLWAPDACPTEVDVVEPETPPATAVPPSGTTEGSDGHLWYASSHHTARFYYCETDDQWQNLSMKYLKTFTSEAELKEAFPTYELHEPCT